MQGVIPKWLSHKSKRNALYRAYINQTWPQTTPVEHIRTARLSVWNRSNLTAATKITQIISKFTLKWFFLYLCGEQTNEGWWEGPLIRYAALKPRPLTVQENKKKTRGHAPPSGCRFNRFDDITTVPSLLKIIWPAGNRQLRMNQHWAFECLLLCL